MNRKLFRILASVEIMLSRGRLRFATLTVPESGLPLREVADRFRRFSRSRFWREVKGRGDYISVYEPHPNGHGWHIHILTNFFIPSEKLRVVSGCYGFGITDIEAADTNSAYYIAKYISKSQFLRKLENGSKNVRLVNVSRGLCALKDVDCTSPSMSFIRSNWYLPQFRGRDLSVLRPRDRWFFLFFLWCSSLCRGSYDLFALERIGRFVDQIDITEDFSSL